MQLFNLLLDDKGVLKMSYGELVDSKLVIKEGPLCDFEPILSSMINEID